MKKNKSRANLRFESATGSLRAVTGFVKYLELADRSFGVHNMLIFRRLSRK
jgi:hypothetical protein